MGDLENEVMPFGKHKGKPLVEVAADSNYIEWMRKKGGFESFLNKIENLNILVMNQQPNDDTPEHNRMQMYYFKPENIVRMDLAAKHIIDYAKKRLYRDLNGTEQRLKAVEAFEKDKVLYREEMEKYFSGCLGYTAKGLTIAPEVKTKSGQYVDLAVSSNNCLLCDEYFEFSWGKARLFSPEFNWAIELKPSIGNDYPSVLRQMIASGMDFRRSRYSDYRGRGVCICWEYNGDEAFNEVQRYFDTHEIDLLLEGPK